jgi:hypothetical protein
MLHPFDYEPVRMPHNDTPLFDCAVNVTANAFAFGFHWRDSTPL